MCQAGYEKNHQSRYTLPAHARPFNTTGNLWHFLLQASFSFANDVFMNQDVFWLSQIFTFFVCFMVKSRCLPLHSDYPYHLTLKCQIASFLTHTQISNWGQENTFIQFLLLKHSKAHLHSTNITLPLDHTWADLGCVPSYSFLACLEVP